MGKRQAGGDLGKSGNGEIVMYKLLAEIMADMLVVVEGVQGCRRGRPGRAQTMAVGGAWSGR